MQPKYFLTITREGSRLYGQPDGDKKFEIFPESQNRFFLKGAPIEVEFIKGSNGEIIKCIVYQGGPHDAKKVK